ncbi:MAG TPA: lipoprotein [Chthoniobacteraceae bacterium]|jgi:hypothetical protein|nr:lipoprotein [Chthoniobacteraceae bacterium]
MKRFLSPLVAVVLLAGCASPKFQAVSSHPVTKGSGGTPTTVASVPFWQSGTPNRPYAILGYVDDYWRGPALDDHDFKKLAPVVKKNGGDAGVVIRGDGPAPGLHRQADEVGESILRLQVIKYQ